MAFVVSIAIHTGLAIGLALIPRVTTQNWDTVDMIVKRPEPEHIPESEPEPEPEPEPEVETKPEPDKPKPKVKEPKSPPPPPPPPQPEPEREEEKEEAPPVFDLGDNSFATKGQNSGWKLSRSEGNTKFGAVAKPGEKPKRSTTARGDSGGKPEGTGFSAVSAKNLSKRPKSINNIEIPSYPMEARREGIEGKVVLQVFIGKDGKVKKIRIVKDPGGGLGPVAKNAMLKERWKPARDRSGKAVDTVITYIYRFILDG
jgi:TonB family protein